jgi:hypothetical protein
MRQRQSDPGLRRDDGVQSLSVPERIGGRGLRIAPKVTKFPMLSGISVNFCYLMEARAGILTGRVEFEHKANIDCGLNVGKRKEGVLAVPLSP